ncbi:MAG: pectin methylesterase-like acyl-CoA thioesterase, partial [Sphingobacteriales bacterium]
MKKPLISALCVLIFNTLLIAQPLIGTYTVGGNGSDFSKINDAVTQLLTFGVAGPVVFKINDGVYEERIKLTEVTGASAASTVTFESTSQDPNKVLITSSGGGVNTDHHTIQLYSCSNISFKYLTVENDHPKMATVIQLTTQGSLGLSANNTIENCILKGSTVSTSSNVILIMLSGINMNSTTGGNQINNNLFANNTLIGGSVGYHQRSSIASAKTGNQFINNYCVGQYLRAIDMRFNVDALTSGNVIDMTHPNFQRFQITGIYSLSGINEEISNNMIIGGFKQATEATGIHVEGVPTEVKVYHNSVVMDNDINEGNAFYIEYSTATGSRSLDIKNNIFYNKGIGNAYKINAPSIEDISSDYNLLYVEAPNNLVSATNFGNFSSLSAYSAASGLETNSISLLPRFISETDLHTTNPLIDATGTGVAVPNDIDGETRNATTPDIGADEFTPIQIDLAIAEINTTTTPKDGVNNIKILLRNEGVQSLNGQKVTILFSIDSGQTWVNPELITLTNLAVTFDETEIELSTTAVFTKGKPLNLGVKLENESAEPFDLNNDNNVLISKLCPYLSGEYTVGAGGDFVSFDNLIEQLACGGVLNNTLIKVKAGTYNTRFTIPKINGVDLSKTLTISSESLDANSVIIESEVPGTTTDHHIIRLDDADFVTLSNLTIKNIVNKPYLSGIHLTNNADNNTILNCRIIVDSTRDDNINKAGIVASSKAGIYGTGQNANNTLIENNLIEGGSYGVRINGQNPNYTEGSIIINNSILRNGYIGIRTFY